MQHMSVCLYAWMSVRMWEGLWAWMCSCLSN